MAGARQQASLWHRIVHGPAKWFFGILTVGVAGYLTKAIEDGSIAATWAWCWQPSNLPNGVGLVAAALVTALLGAGCLHLWVAWRRRSSPVQEAAPQEPFLAFRGAVYDRQLWSWNWLLPPGDPQELTPLCPTDGAALIADEEDDEPCHPLGGHDPYAEAEAERDGLKRLFCADCRQAVIINATLFERIPRLIQRDLKAGAWEARQREFDEAIRRAAASSKRIGRAPPSAPGSQ